MDRPTKWPCFTWLLYCLVTILLASCASKRTGGGLIVDTYAPPTLSISDSIDHYSPNRIISAFYQGATGNCAAIAVIKTTIAVFKDRKVYKKDPADSTIYILNNSDSVKLTANDRKVLALKDKFVLGTDIDIYNKAKFLYALIVANKRSKAELRYKSLENAADALNGKEAQTARDIIPLLGLKPLDHELYEAAFQEHVIVTNYYHAAFSSRGYYDEYGTKTLVSDLKSNHHGFFHSSDLSGAYSIDPRLNLNSQP